ncbi:MAG: efflux RND transporter periplasmic adaptor subunit [Desulfovibrionaceae bacterium]
MRFSLHYVLLASIALLATVFASGCNDDKAANGAPMAAPAPTEVTVVTITPRPVTLSTVLPGRTSPFLMAEVRPQVSGIIQKRLFQEGAEVKAGELLYQIDPAPYQAAYDNAKAALGKAEANVLPAKLRAERYQELAKANALAKQDNDDAQAAFLQAQAEVVAAKAALETTRINLSYTRVTSPIAGRIGRSAVTPGALVTANQAAALSTVQQTNPIYVDVTQSSNDLLRLKRDLASGRLKSSVANGAAVSLLYEDGSRYPLQGRLQFADITVDQSTGVVTLRTVFPNPDGDLLPGLYVRAVLEEGVNEHAILAPQRAVSRDAKGNAVAMVVRPDNTVAQRAITVDRVMGEDWLVTSGLAAGDRVIVEGLQKVRPGAAVTAVEATAKPAAQSAITGPQPVNG